MILRNQDRKPLLFFPCYSFLLSYGLNNFSLVNNHMKLKKKVRRVQCMRCEQFFPSFNALKVHSRTHLQMQEMKMLQQGHIPDETKMGVTFRGKNKIIVS